MGLFAHTQVRSTRQLSSGAMYLLLRPTNRLDYKIDIAKRIRKLIDDVSHSIYLDTQRLAVMRHFQQEYCRKQFNVLAADCVTLNVYCMRFNHKTLDYGRIWDKWL